MPLLTGILAATLTVMHTRYVMNSEGHFQRAVHVPVKAYEDAHRQVEGLPADLAATRLDFLGPNAIPFKRDTILQSVKDEFFRPFYLYQLMVYMVWCAPPVTLRRQRREEAVSRLDMRNRKMGI
jgi:hypothetical protein